MNKIYDYSGFVELYCSEEDGDYRSFPSKRDVYRHFKRLIPLSHGLDGQITVNEDLMWLDKDVVNLYYGNENPFETVKSNKPVVDEYWLNKYFKYYQYFEILRHHTFGEWYSMSKCPFCRINLDVSRINSVVEMINYVDIRICPQCGWWETEEHLHVSYPNNDEHYVADSIHRRSTLREFNVSDLHIPISLLEQHVKKNKIDLYGINPKNLELLIYNIFKEHLDCKVHHVGGSNDGGIDILIIEGVKKYGIQVKRRESSKSAESVQVVREMIGSMVINELSGGIIITTAPHYSKQSINAARKSIDLGHFTFLDLIDFPKLESLLDLRIKDQESPWSVNLSTAEEIVQEGITPGSTGFLDMIYDNKNGDDHKRML